MKKNFTLFVALFVFAILKAQTPKVYYPFDGQSLNSTFGAYPLSTVNGSASFTTATHNGNGTHALTLDGLKYESTPFVYDTNATGLTISFWMNRQPNQGNGVLVSQLDVVQSGGGMTNYYGTFNTVLWFDGRLVMELYTSQQSSSAITSADTVPYGWHFVTFTWNGNKKYIYQNGVLTDSSGAQGSIFKAGASVDLRIGAVKYYPAGGQPTFQSPYIGQIDEVRLYESALTGQQILNLYNNGTISGVNQLNTDMAIGIYPNPVSEFLEISCDEPIETAEVYNVIGEQVIFVKDQITKLNVATLANGLYTIQLKTIGGKTVVKKFTKQ